MTTYREINFHKTMGINKRGENAYLRNNWLDNASTGLYPSIDFLEIGVVVGTIKKIVDNIIFSQDGDNIKVYLIKSDGTITHKFDVEEKDFFDATQGNNKNAHKGIHFATSDERVYYILNNLNGFGMVANTNIQVEKTSFDGLYYWYHTESEIYRQLKDNPHEKVFEDMNGIIDYVDFYNGYMVMARQNHLSFNLFFWDKKSNTELQKIMTEKNSRLVGMGVVESKIMVIHGVGNIGNIKEKNGEIIVSVYNGAYLTKLNSIKSGAAQIGGGSVAVGKGFLISTITDNHDNHNETLYNNWILKIKSNGAIETLYYNRATYNKDRTVSLDYESVYISEENKILNNRDKKQNNYTYRDFTTSEYITEFLNNNSNIHQLESVGVSFEKIFQTHTATKGENLILEYRTSERDDWQLLHRIDVKKIWELTGDKFDKNLLLLEMSDNEKDMTVQSYTITKLPNNETLPRFNEIQFRLKSKNGFSLLKMWYYYKHIKRNKYDKKRN